jgi:hypothetical protein
MGFLAEWRKIGAPELRIGDLPDIRKQTTMRITVLGKIKAFFRHTDKPKTAVNLR